MESVAVTARRSCGTAFAKKSVDVNNDFCCESTEMSIALPTDQTVLRKRSTAVWLPVACLLLLLIVAVPLFLRMPLTNDTEVYDLQAAGYRAGGMLYRDFLEPNLPGVIWVHLTVRGIAGDSPEAMRLFDLLLFCVTATLACRLVVRAGGGAATAIWTAFGMAAFYLTCSEWCHCQRDVWMLCPALAAVSLREAAFDVTCGKNRYIRSLLEGLFWGTAVWLKPHVVVPGVLVWVVSLRSLPRKSLVIPDVLGLLSGGLIMGGLGVSWMHWVGCWPAFLETLRDWNPAYFRAGRMHWTFARYVAMTLRQGPWSVLHLIALFITLRLLVRQIRQRDASSAAAVVTMLAALYAGWMVQALFLQHLFDYIHAPTILLALLLIVAQTVQAPPQRLWVPAAWMSFALLAVCASPLLRSGHLGAWSACWQRDTTPALRDRLAYFPNPDRQDLAKIAEYLQTEGVTGRDVCFYNSDFVSLYRQLDLLPPVRYTYFFETIQFFPERRRAILNELQQSPHRFVVTDLVSVGMPRRDAEAVGPDGPLQPPPAYRRAPREVYPWSCPVVFRAGTYLVHRVPTASTTVMKD